MEISVTYSSGFKTEFISTKNLCAGRYEFWFVVRYMNGDKGSSTIQYIKPFFSEYPTCSEKQYSLPCQIITESEEDMFF